MLKPLFDTHSIEAISVTCEFTEDVSSAGLEIIRAEAKRLQTKLPYRRVRRKAAQNMPSHDLTASAPAVVGYMFYSKTKDEESDSFEIYEQRAAYTSKAYSNFDSFLADSSFYLELAKSAFAHSDAKLKRIVLRYQDKFTSETADWEPLDSLRENSKYLPAVCLARKDDFWHAATGFFGTAMASDLLLHNIKADHSVRKVGDDFDENEYIVSIDCIHVYEFSPAKVISAEGVFKNSYTETLEYLRKENKNILHEILSDELSARIGLKKSKQE